MNYINNWYLHLILHSYSTNRFIKLLIEYNLVFKNSKLFVI